jgi:hypothetical protein
MAEIRGAKPDRRLCRNYEFLHKNGTQFVKADEFQRYLSSQTLKMRPKTANVTGLQIADVLAHPSLLYIRSTYNNEPAPTRFAGRLVTLLRDSKYQRDARDTLFGFGIKWLP